MTFSELQEDDRPDFTKEREELNELLRISKENEARLSENNRQLLEKYEQLMEKYRKIESEYQYLNKKYDEIGKKLENSRKEAFESKVPVDNSVRIEKPPKPDLSTNFDAKAFDETSNKSVLISRRRPEEINTDHKIKEFSTSFEASSGKSDKIKKIKDDLKSLEESSIISRRIEKSEEKSIKVQEEGSSVVFSKKAERIVKENIMPNMGVSMADSRKIEKKERKNMEPPSFKYEAQIEEMVFSTKIEKKAEKNEADEKKIEEEMVYSTKIEKKPEKNDNPMVFSRRSSARFTSPKNAETMAFSRKIEKIPSKNEEYSGKHQEISTQTPLNTENPLDESLISKEKNDGNLQKEPNYRRSSTENIDKLLNSMLLYKARVMTIHQSHQKNRSVNLHMSQISQNIPFQNMRKIHSKLLNFIHHKYLDR